MDFQYRLFAITYYGIAATAAEIAHACCGSLSLSSPCLEEIACELVSPYRPLPGICYWLLSVTLAERGENIVTINQLGHV